MPPPVRAKTGQADCSPVSVLFAHPTPPAGPDGIRRAAPFGVSRPAGETGSADPSDIYCGVYLLTTLRGEELLRDKRKKELDSIVSDGRLTMAEALGKSFY